MAELHTVGTMACIIESTHLQDGTMNIDCRSGSGSGYGGCSAASPT